jgi:hypothetical protein
MTHCSKNKWPWLLVNAVRQLVFGSDPGLVVGVARYLKRRAIFFSTLRRALYTLKQ